MSKNNGEIVFTKYGPYTVVDTKIERENGERVETPRVVSLCRCGESKNKPFCDGTHGEIGFVGERESEDREGINDYVGKRITVHDNRHICSHHGTCNMDGVFLSKGDPWIVPDGTDDIEAIIEIVKKCPSGALSYTLNGKHEDSWTKDQKIVVAKDGPLHVEGNVELKDDLDSDKSLVSENHYTLCRCGKSKNKPFCDGSHIDAEFKG